MTSFVNIDFSDHALLSPTPVDHAEIYRWFEQMKEHDVDGAMFRVSIGGRVACHGSSWSEWGPTCYRDPARAQRVRDVMAICDPPAVAVEAARATGRKVYLWITPYDLAIWRRDVSAVDPYFATYPFFCSANRRGGYWVGIPSYTHTQARERLVSLVKHLASYKPDGIFLCTRTHAYEPWGWTWGWGAKDHFPPDDEFGYGFDEPVVAEYQRRHNIDIRTQPFDLAQWHQLKGEFFTSLLRELRNAVPREIELLLNIHPDRLTAVCYTRRTLQVYKDWETWKSEGLINGLSLHMGRETIDDLSAASPFTSLRSDKFKIFTWLDLFGAGKVKNVEQCRVMTNAVKNASVDGVLWHQLTDWLHDTKDGTPAREIWNALHP